MTNSLTITRVFAIQGMCFARLLHLNRISECSNAPFSGGMTRLALLDVRSETPHMNLAVAILEMAPMACRKAPQPFQGPRWHRAHTKSVHCQVSKSGFLEYMYLVHVDTSPMRQAYVKGVKGKSA
jgi:hypothetical protein